MQRAARRLPGPQATARTPDRGRRSTRWARRRVQEIGGRLWRRWCWAWSRTCRTCRPRGGSRGGGEGLEAVAGGGRRCRERSAGWRYIIASDRCTVACNARRGRGVACSARGRGAGPRLCAVTTGNNGCDKYHCSRGQNRRYKAARVPHVRLVGAYLVEVHPRAPPSSDLSGSIFNPHMSGDQRATLSYLESDNRMDGITVSDAGCYPADPAAGHLSPGVTPISPPGLVPVALEAHQRLVGGDLVISIVEAPELARRDHPVAVGVRLSLGSDLRP